MWSSSLRGNMHCAFFKHRKEMDVDHLVINVSGISFEFRIETTVYHVVAALRGGFEQCRGHGASNDGASFKFLNFSIWMHDFPLLFMQRQDLGLVKLCFLSARVFIHLPP